MSQHCSDFENLAGFAGLYFPSNFYVHLENTVQFMRLPFRVNLGKLNNLNTQAVFYVQEKMI